MQTNASGPRTRVAAPTASYLRLLGRIDARRTRKSSIPVAVLARIIDFGAEVTDRGGAIVLSFDRESWRRLAPDRAEYILTALRRYTDVYAVFGDR